MDANLLHISYEGRDSGESGDGAGGINVAIGVFRLRKRRMNLSIWMWSLSGDIVALNGNKLSPASVLKKLNQLGGKHGIGRLDLVENRYVGMKSRGCYETPGGTILLRAHRAIESITLDREVAHLKDDLMPRYAALIYNGYWWSPNVKSYRL